MDEWRGDPYLGAAHVLALQSEAARLVALKREADVDLSAADMELAGSAPDTTAIEALVHADPLDERRWALLMKALYRSGRQADALNAYQRASRLLGEQLGLEPGPELKELEERILLHDPNLRPAGTSPVVALPGFATSMVGRSEQVATLAKRLGEHRLMTVTGLGGVGKTRLAVAAAHAAVVDFPDGAVFIPLDPVSDAGLVADAITSHLDIAPSVDPVDALVHHLADRQIVLVLDNCEHVVDEVARLVSRILTSSPGTGLLCTSRMPIGVTGETSFPVGPLPVPPPGQEFTTPDNLLRYESIALFCDRARLARPEFTFDAESAPVIAEIVRRLAGIPLSIEIAAANSDLLNPADILDRIEAAPQLLVAEERDRADRHQSMAEAVAWSLDLLDEPARELFKRMSVFHSPVDAETLEAVCRDDVLDSGAIYGSLAALVRSSLVPVDFDTARARYVQLPPIRGVALDLLGSDEPSVRQRHLDHFAALASAEVDSIGGPGEAASFERLTSVIDELRSALHFAITNRPEIGRQMCVDLGTYWLRSGRTKEARAWVGQFTDSELDVPNITASLSHLAGSLALVEHDLEAADEALTAALQLRRDLGLRRELGMTLSNLGGLANSRKDYGRAESLFREALEVFGKEKYERGGAAARLNLGLALLNRGEIEAAAQEIQFAVDGFRRLGDRGEEAHALSRLGFAHAALGDLARAEACRLAGHRIAQNLGRVPDLAFSHMNLAAHYLEISDLDLAKEHAASSAKLVVEEDLERWWIPNLVELAAGIEADAGDPEEGARFLGCAAAYRRAYDLPVLDAGKAFHNEMRQRIEASLGNKQFLIEMEVGGTRTLLDGVRAVAAWS